MTTRNDEQHESAGPLAGSEPTLRQRAEEQVRAEETQELAALSPEETRRLVHELRVHQIELEMQNQDLRRAQQELEVSWARYFDLYDLAPVGYLTVNQESSILEANLTAATLLGVARGALVRQPLTRYILPEDQDIYYLHRKQLLDTGEPQACELRLVRPDGNSLWVRAEGILATDADSEAPVCRVVMSDITARKQVEEARQGGEEKYRAVADFTYDWEYWLGPDGRYIYVSPSCERITGYRAEEFLQDPALLERIVHPDDRALVGAHVKQGILHDGDHTIDFRVVTRGGEERWIGHCCQPVYGHQGQYLGQRGSHRDITKRKHDEENVMKYRSIVSSTPDGIALLDESYRYVIINDAYERFSGVNQEQLVGLTVADYLGEDVFQRLVKPKLDSCLQGQVVNYQEWFDYPALGRRFVDITYFPYRDARNHIAGVVSNTRDITERKQAEEALHESEQLLRKIADNYPNSYLSIVERDLTIGFTSGQEFKKRGLDPTSFVGMTLEQVFADYAPFVREHYLKAFDGVETEFELFINDQHQFYRVVPLVDDRGRVERILAVVENISERKRAEEERQAHLWFLESLDHVNQAIQKTTDLEQMMSDVLDVVLTVFDCDRAWLVYPCDPAATSWSCPMERTRPEYPGALALALEVPIDSDVVRVYRAVLASDGPVQFHSQSEHPLPAAVAEQFNEQSQIAMAIYPKGDKPYMFGLHQCSYPRVWTPQEERLLQEIGRRLTDGLTSLLMLRSLRESEGKLAAAQSVAHVGYWELDVNTDCITWSDETYRIFGLRPQERRLSLAQLAELLHPEDRHTMVQAVAEALRGGPRYDVEYRLVRPNGQVRVVHSQGDATWDKSGQPLRMFGVVQDVTERKRAEEALQASEERFRKIVENTDAGYFFVDRDGRYKRVNDAWLRLHGYTSPDEVLGQHFSLTQVEVDLEQAQRVVERLLGGGSIPSGEFTRRRKDGSVGHHSFSASSVVRGGEIVGLEGFLIDTSERRQAQEALQKREQELRLTLEATTDGIWTWNFKTDVLSFSPRYYTMLGYEPDEFPATFENWRDLIHPDDLDAALSTAQTYLATKPDSYENEFRLRTKAGDYRWVRARGRVVERDANGDAVRMIGNHEDISERKRAQEEIQRLYEQARRDAATKTVLLQEIHHRVKNNLQIISSLLDLQADQVGDHTTLQALQDSRHRVRAMALVHESLYQTPDLARLDLGMYVRELLSYLVSAYEQPALRFDLDVHVEAVLLDLDRAIPCGLILTELVSNALKYAFPLHDDRLAGGMGTLQVALQARDARVELAVRDDGVGLPADVDPQTSSSLGLRIVQLLSHQLEGQMKVDSAPGKGTAFKITFPLLAEERV